MEVLENIKEIRVKWLKELRKHPEQQGKYHLGIKEKGTTKMCCLGKYCEVSGLGEWKTFDDGNASFVDDFNHTTLSESFEKLGLYSTCGDISTTLDKYCRLSDANDNGVTWPEIADFIEANPHKVFTDVNDPNYFKS